MDLSIPVAGLIGSLAAGAATGIGTIPLFLLSRNLTRRHEPIFLSFMRQPVTSPNTADR